MAVKRWRADINDGVRQLFITYNGFMLVLNYRRYYIYKSFTRRPRGAVTRQSAVLTSITQHAMSRKLDSVWEMES